MPTLQAHAAEVLDREADARAPKIVTAFVYPPIPVRTFDWQATYDGDEPNDDGQMAVGSGATEAEAVTDLIENNPRNHNPFEDLILELFASKGMLFRETRLRGRPIYCFCETDGDGTVWTRRFDTIDDRGTHAMRRLRDAE